MPEFERLIAAIIKKNISAENLHWLTQQGLLIKQEETAAKLNMAFVFIHRKTGHNPVIVSAGDEQAMINLVPGFSINNWTIDRLCRLWILLQIPPDNQEVYCKKIEGLFSNADMNEQSALYASLYFFAYPHKWQQRCAEGIRSNIGTVLEAIMYNNPYPAKYLEEKAWNQLVLKAFFTEKDINRIVGIDERSNKDLAVTLLDYASERWAAHRVVHPQLWRLLTNFVDEAALPYFNKLLLSDDEKENKAAALALHHSPYQQGKELLNQYPYLVTQLKEQDLSWSAI